MYMTFCGKYAELKNHGFKFYSNGYGIKYHFEIKEYYDGIWIIKSGSMILDYRLNHIELTSEMVDFAVLNRELIESTDDFDSNGNVNKISPVFNTDKNVFTTSESNYKYKKYYLPIANLKIWLWLHDNNYIQVGG